mmetsp:Transcript_26051/g.66151  ORF Transcript_26051/g.66151 Transcript_26051/m.66151 type:complete len:257 (-) Transcript_26051:895-1665(-)
MQQLEQAPHAREAPGLPPRVDDKRDRADAGEQLGDVLDGRDDAALRDREDIEPEVDRGILLAAATSHTPGGGGGTDDRVGDVARQLARGKAPPAPRRRGRFVLARRRPGGGGARGVAFGLLALPGAARGPRVQSVRDLRKRRLLRGSGHLAAHHLVRANATVERAARVRVLAERVDEPGEAHRLRVRDEHGGDTHAPGSERGVRQSALLILLRGERHARRGRLHRDQPADLARERVVGEAVLAHEPLQKVERDAEE